MSVCDIHKYHRADKAVGSSVLNLANPALSQPKSVMGDRDNDLQCISACNKGSEACTALGKHLYIADGAK